MLDSISLKNTISNLIRKSNNLKQFKQIHAHIITSPEKDHNFLISRLLFSIALSNSGSLSYAGDIFSTSKNQSLNLYNIMIRAYASKTKSDDETHQFQTMELYKKMLRNGIQPDCITLPFVIKDCTKKAGFELGLSVHCHSIKFCLYGNTFVQNTLVNFYLASGFAMEARKVFDEMTEKDVVSWNSMIIGISRRGYLDEALSLFRKMEERNLITWNSMITGFVQGGRPKEALELFREMQCWSEGASGVRPDKITIASVLSACASIGAIDVGKWVHIYLNNNDVECDTVIGTALVDMYGKCGCLKEAYEVFKSIAPKDTLAWTAMISVLALHGHGTMAFDVFHEMEAERVKPNHVTFVSLLSACAHSGLVEKGRWCFNVMRRAYSIEPQVYHFACMVDVLARAGLFDEAEELIGSMPMKPDEYVWGALLGGCQMHRNVELGERVAKHLIDVSPLNHAYYVNLLDVYAKAFRYEDVKIVRNLMRERGVMKEVPGCSMIEINGVVHEFSVSGSSSIRTEELSKILSALSSQMKINGNTNCHLVTTEPEFLYMIC